MEIFFYFFFLWLPLSFFIGFFAERKGLPGPAFFFLSLLLSPLVGLVAVVLAAPNKARLEKESLRSGEMRKCPYCAELIRTEAIKCRYCGSEVAPSDSPEPAVVQRALSTQKTLKDDSNASAPCASVPKGVLSNTQLLIIVAIIVAIALGVLYSSTKTSGGYSNVATEKASSSVSGDGADAQSNPAAPSYTVVEQWSIPNGGFVRVIVVKANSTEAELRALGEKLKRDTRAERNAIVYVYDDQRAARNRGEAFSENLPKAELQHHDRHRVALYWRNANTGVHELDLTSLGLDGPNIKVTYTY